MGRENEREKMLPVDSEVLEEVTDAEDTVPVSSVDVNGLLDPLEIASIAERLSTDFPEDVSNEADNGAETSFEVALEHEPGKNLLSLEKGIPADLGKNVIRLECKSNGPAGVCYVHIVGTAHVSKESCMEVQAVIRYVKPEVVFLELCRSRVSILLPQKLEVPTFSKMLESWKKKEMNAFGLLYSWFLAKVGEKLEVLPGAEFRVGYEEALACGAKVILGDRPVHITLRRTWAKMSMWNRVKFVSSILRSSVFMPSADELDAMIQKMEQNDEVTFMIQELSETYPTLSETLIRERDLYMVASLRNIARQHTSVVAVIGRGHLSGVATNWKEDICVEELLVVPKKRSSRLGLWSVSAIAVGGFTIVLGVHYMRRR